LECERP